MKKLTFVIVLLISLIFSISCTSGGNTVVPDPANVTVSESRVDAVIGVWSAEIDPAKESFTVSLDEDRQSVYHHPLTQSFPDVIQVVGYGFTPNFWADIKLQHPLPGSGHDGFDPRIIAIIPIQSHGTYFYYPALGGIYANNSVLLEPDGYTKLFDSLGGSMPGNTNPFKAYFKDQSYRRWSSTGMTMETQRWNMDLAGFGGPLRFKLVVDVSVNYPNPPQPVADNAPESVKIDATIEQGLSQNGGYAEVTATLLDWQGQSGIGGVKVESPDLFDGTVDLTYSASGPNPNEYVYTGIIENSLLAPVGEYAMLVAAWDRSTGIYLYNEFPVEVREPGTGNLTVQLDGSSPSSAIVLGGTSDNLMAKFKFHSDDVEPFTVHRVTLNLTDGWQSVKYLTVEYPRQDGTTGEDTVSPSTYLINFVNLDMYVGRNNDAILTVKAEFYEIGIGGTFGDRIATNFDWLGAVGMNSGEALYSDNDVDASPMYLYKTKIDVTANNYGLSIILVPGVDTILYKFKVIADPHGEAAVKKFTFLVSIGDNRETSPDADLSEFTFWHGDVNITSMCQITAISVDGGNTYLSPPLKLESVDRVEGNLQTWVQVTFDNLPADGGEQVITAGSTETYSLRAMTGTGFRYGDAVLVRLLGDTTPASGHYLSDLDSTIAEHVVALQDSSGMQIGSDLELIWSDHSSANHSSSFDDDGVTELSSPDWSNGHLVQEFPLPARVLMLV